VHLVNLSLYRLEQRYLLALGLELRWRSRLGFGLGREGLRFGSRLGFCTELLFGKDIEISMDYYWD